jgi:hypothetical protein
LSNVGHSLQNSIIEHERQQRSFRLCSVKLFQDWAHHGLEASKRQLDSRGEKVASFE